MTEINLSKKKKIKINLDQYLLDHDYVESLKMAAARILAGEVKVDDMVARSPKQLVTTDSKIEVKTLAKYVSRAGDKIFSAIQKFKLEDLFKAKVILDLGSSTGGFTDCVLQLGASHVFCIDVGTNQLAWKLRKDSRISVLEKQDARELGTELFQEKKIDWVLMDLSFISSRLVLQSLNKIFSKFHKETKLLVLLKPQFELPSSMIPEGGVVLDPKSWDKCILDFKSFLESSSNFKYLEHHASKLKGRQGNQEFFFYLDFVEYK